VEVRNKGGEMEIGMKTLWTGFRLETSKTVGAATLARMGV
jgi:hypothetical protein